nr:hypothetical protein CFP56_62154 [Quercus suber]
MVVIVGSMARWSSRGTAEGCGFLTSGVRAKDPRYPAPIADSSHATLPPVRLRSCSEETKFKEWRSASGGDPGRSNQGLCGVGKKIRLTVSLVSRRRRKTVVLCCLSREGITVRRYYVQGRDWGSEGRNERKTRPLGNDRCLDLDDGGGGC